MSDCGTDQMPTQLLERALASLIARQMWSLKGGFKKWPSWQVDCSRCCSGSLQQLDEEQGQILVHVWFTELALLLLPIQTLRSVSPGLLFLIAPSCIGIP